MKTKTKMKSIKKCKINKQYHNATKEKNKNHEQPQNKVRNMTMKTKQKTTRTNKYQMKQAI